MWPGGLSVQYKEQCTDSLAYTYIFIGPKRIHENEPDFGSKDQFTAVILHEFIHPFMMKYCLQHRELIESYSHLYEENAEIYRKNGCPTWFDAVNEITTRTVEIILNAGNDSEKVVELINNHTNAQGFKYIPILYKAFESYYPTDKRNSISFENIFSLIINSFNELEETNINATQHRL